MIPYNSTPLFNVSQTNSIQSVGNSKRNSINYNPINLKPKSNSFSFSKDSEWLTLEICREYLRGECLRDEFSCRYAHPAKNIETQGGRVICCYDYLKSKCHRHKPACKYLHPPIHLKEQLLQKGKSNLILKNLQFSFLTNSPQPVNISRPQSALPYNMNNISLTSNNHLSQSQNVNSLASLGNMQALSYAPSVMPYVIIPPSDSNNLSNLHYTHMAIDASQLNCNHKMSLQKSNYINQIPNCGVIPGAHNHTAIPPYQSMQQYSFTKSFCFPYQPVLFKDWPIYTYTTVPY